MSSHLDLEFALAVVAGAQRRASAATSGPWITASAGDPVKAEEGHDYFCKAEDESIVRASDRLEIIGTSEWMRVRRQDLEFMAVSRTDVEVLATLVTQLVERIRAAERVATVAEGASQCCDQAREHVVWLPRYQRWAISAGQESVLARWCPFCGTRLPSGDG